MLEDEAETDVHVDELSATPSPFLETSTGQGAACQEQVVASILGDLDSDGDGVVDGAEIADFLSKSRIDLSQIVRKNGFSEDGLCR